MSTATPLITTDDDRLRVTTWTFTDRASTGVHRHEFDYVVVPVTGGRFEVSAPSPDGPAAVRDMVQSAGVAYQGRAGTEHDVTNVSGRDAVFVEVELKS